jgi:hypothetical protein
VRERYFIPLMVAVGILAGRGLAYGLCDLDGDCANKAALWFMAGIGWAVVVLVACARAYPPGGKR